MQSNAFRYDENKEEDVSDTQDTSRDFRILSKASINQGHFQFKSDKALFDQEEHKTQNAFDMDLKLLSLSLSTIPFHLRHNIDIEYINVSSLVLFDYTDFSELLVYLSNVLLFESS